jgi:hypothetical protein
MSIQQEARQRTSPTVPICPGCRTSMVLEGKRPMPSTNLVEVTHRCESRTKRIVKEP